MFKGHNFNTNCWIINRKSDWLLQYETSIAWLGNFCLNMLNIVFQSKVIVLQLSEIISSTIFFSSELCFVKMSEIPFNHLPMHFKLWVFSIFAAYWNCLENVKQFQCSGHTLDT